MKYLKGTLNPGMTNFNPYLTGNYLGNSGFSGGPWGGKA